MDPSSLICREVTTSSVCFSQDSHPAAAMPVQPGHSWGHADASPPKKSRLARILWGLSGGTALSVVGFVALALYQQYNDGLTELRNDLKHFNVTSGDLVKREELHNRMTNIHTAMKDWYATSTEKNTRLALLEQQFKASEEERKELGREVQRLRERLAAAEARQSAPRTDRE